MTASHRPADLAAFMPVVFVLIWSTGFVVARFGMPFAPPMRFLAWPPGPRDGGSGCTWA
jgi:hypothetical protein